MQKFAFLLIVVALCSNLPGILTSRIDPDLANSANLMAIDYFKVALSNVPSNFICSPLCVSQILTMLAFGARGRSKEQLLKALHLDDVLPPSSPLDYIFLKNIDSYSLNMANNIYISKYYDFDRKFAANVTTFFESFVQSIDFDRPRSSANHINEWVSIETDDYVTDLIDPKQIDKYGKMFLVSAIYLRAPWKIPFPKQNTEEKIFYLDNSKTKLVETMRTTGYFNYKKLENLDAQIIELPYLMPARSESISMYIIVPNTIEGLKKIEENIKEINLKTLQSGESLAIDLLLPKFKLETNVTAVAHLYGLELYELFSYDAQLEGITDKKPFHINQVVQRAFIEVNENGTEGSVAATGVNNMISTIPYQFHVNRPFLFVIASPHVIIYTARVNHPLF